MRMRDQSAQTTAKGADDHRHHWPIAEIPEEDASRELRFAVYKWLRLTERWMALAPAARPGLAADIERTTTEIARLIVAAGSTEEG